MDKKVVTLFNNSLSRGSTPSRSSLNISLNKSRQGIKSIPSVHIVLKSASNVVERCGLPIPVLVEEAFSFTDRNVAITARVSECGYAWVVCGRKLFIWQFQVMNTQECMKQLKFPICYELRLPQSDLAHRAELVTVFINKKSSHPSCVAVSPEGMVRYWPDITQDHCSVDKNVELNGEECDSLIDAGSLGCIFVTTTCTVVLIQYKRGSYGDELNCHTLKTPRSWIGGVSRRVSSIFFGPISSDQGNEPKTVRLLAIPGIQSSYSIYVLAGMTLQKWSISEQNVEQLSWSTDLSRAIKESFRSQVPHWEVCDPEIDMWILDMQPDREGVLMLCAAVNLRTSPQVYYGMISFAVNFPNPPVEPRDFLLLKIMGLYRENNSAEVLSYKFILCGTTAYIYSTKSITVVNPMEDPDRLEFLHPTDHIFGGCSCRNIPVFFSRKYGLVVISGHGDGDRSFVRGGSSSFADVSLLDQNVSMHNLSLYRMNPSEIYSAHRDTDAQLKAAFIFHVKNQLNDCYNLVNKLFPMDVPTLPSFDGPLDVTVVTIAKDILDDIPAGDSRWTRADGSSQGLGSSHSMLVNQQLLDKQLAYSLFLKFLKESGLWRKLSGITLRNSHAATINLLAELGEKIVAALTLKNAPFSCMLENAIEKTVKNYSTKVGGGLSNHDVFYREITRIHEGFLWLTKSCKECAHSTADPLIISRNIHDGNQVMLRVLSDVLHYRKQSADVFCLNDITNSMGLEYLPWTAAGGPEGIMDVLMLQHSLTLNYGLKVIEDTNSRELLLEEFVLLTDIILDGRKSHLATVKSQHEKVLYKQYCTDRHRLIRPLIDVNAPTEALMLAEKYLDFEILMRVCEANNNEDRIDEYMRRFKDTDFSEFVYNWYMREGKQSKLLIRYRKTDNSLPEGRARLGRFLAAYPTLSWIQHICDKDFSKSADILLQLGENEYQYVSRQKSMFSLSKLARLSAKDPNNPSEHLETINKYLELISYQEQIPDYVVQHHGYNAKKPKVLHPREIVSLYISTQYVDAKELEFRKALDVANFLDSIEKVELILQVWRAALLRDTWQFASLDQPLECLQNTMFFRLIDISINLGYDASTLLPPIDMLLDDSSLDDLRQNPSFEPLLKTGYEQFHRLQML